MIVGWKELADLAESLNNLETELGLFIANKMTYDRVWQSILISYNQENISKGLRPDGSIISKTPVGKQKSTMYERYTIYNRTKEGKQVKNVDLNFTGLFYASESIRATPNNIYFIDTAPYAEKIESVWGNVLGITDAQFEEFFEFVKPDFEKWLNKRLNGR